MYVVSYCFIIAFHKSYCLNKITVLRSFNDSLEELADISFLLNEMLEFKDPVTTSQLLSYIQKVISKKSHLALMGIFCCELEFVVDICNNWIYQKFTKQRFFLDFATKKKFKEQNPLNFNDDCCICGFELGVTKTYGASSDKRSYCDFVIKKEHHFL